MNRKRRLLRNYEQASIGSSGAQRKKYRQAGIRYSVFTVDYAGLFDPENASGEKQARGDGNVNHREIHVRGKILEVIDDVVILPNGRFHSSEPQWRIDARQPRRHRANHFWRNQMGDYPLLAWEANGCNAVWVNNYYRDFVGRSVDPLGLGWEDILHPADMASGQVEQYAQACKERRQFRGRIKLLRRDGQFRMFRVVATPCGENGMIGACIDITCAADHAAPVLKVFAGGAAANRGKVAPVAVSKNLP